MITNTTIKQKEVIQNTKKCIIDVASQLFSEYSYLGVSMSDIAKKLNITKAALYYHFTGKAEVYEKVLDDILNDLGFVIKQSANETTIEKKMYKLVTNYLDFGCKKKNFIKVLMSNLSPNNLKITKHITQFRKEIINLLYPITREISKNKKINKKVDIRLLTSMLTSMMDGLILEHSILNKKMNSKKVSSQIITVFFDNC
jgi:AcrR family transcriptional regulator